MAPTLRRCRFLQSRSLGRQASPCSGCAISRRRSLTSALPSMRYGPTPNASGNLGHKPSDAASSATPAATGMCVGIASRLIFAVGLAQELAEGSVRVVVRAHETRAGDCLFDCRGHLPDWSDLSSPLIASLVCNGLVRPDQLGIGLDVAPDCNLVAQRPAMAPAVRKRPDYSRAFLGDRSDSGHKNAVRSADRINRLDKRHVVWLMVVPPQRTSKRLRAGQIIWAVAPWTSVRRPALGTDQHGRGAPFALPRKTFPSCDVLGFPGLLGGDALGRHQGFWNIST